MGEHRRFDRDSHIDKRRRLTDDDHGRTRRQYTSQSGAHRHREYIDLVGSSEEDMYFNSSFYGNGYHDRNYPSRRENGRSHLHRERFTKTTDDTRSHHIHNYNV